MGTEPGLIAQSLKNGSSSKIEKLPNITQEDALTCGSDQGYES